MKLEYFHYKLQFRYPFKLSLSTRSHTDLVIVKLTHKNYVGYGEASLPPHFDESIKSVEQFFNKIDVKKLIKIQDLPCLLKYVDGIDNENNAAKAAIDIALHDLLGKIDNKSIYEIYGLQKPKEVFTCFSIGMCSLIELKEKIKIADGIKMIKLKLGGKNDKNIIENYQSICNKPFCVDVNQGWANKEEALEMIKWLSDKGAVFIEQPLQKDKWKDMEWLFERSPLPIISDESIKRLKDIDRAIGKFHGINIKLMKSTGIHEAFKMIKRAKELNLKVLIGCMAESSCAVSAAWHLSSLADWVDLDAPLLTLDDPFDGIVYHDGEVLVNGNEGLGVYLNQND